MGRYREFRIIVSIPMIHGSQMSQGNWRKERMYNQITSPIKVGMHPQQATVATINGVKIAAACQVLTYLSILTLCQAENNNINRSIFRRPNS